MIDYNRYNRIPRRILEYVHNRPNSGGGVHNWLFGSALRLHKWLSPGEITSLLARLSVGCGRKVPEREIRQAVENSYRRSQHPKRKFNKWGSYCSEAVKYLTENEAITVADLKELSPSRTDSIQNVIEFLFPENVLLCVGEKPNRFRTYPKQLLDFERNRYPLIVPSPMKQQYGKTQSGKISMRTNANVGRRMHLVIEFDGHDLNTQATLHWHLSKYLPLVLCLFSGNKSIHGWYFVEYLEDREIRGFMNHAISLGADPATWTPCQLVRTPLGIRKDNNRIQEILYLNRSADYYDE